MNSLHYISILQDFLWTYIPIFLILLGIFFFITTRGAQLPNMFSFKKLFSNHTKNSKGISPIKLVFAAAGGMIGIGNIILPITALKLAGAGSMFWLWIGSLVGMTVKYSEIFLAVKYRTVDKNGNYIGGIMYYLEHAFSSRVLAIIAGISLCIYGVEILQFAQMVEGVDSLFEGSYKKHITLLLLILLIYGVFHGIQFQAELSIVLIPIFFVGYVVILILVLYDYIDQIIPMFADIFYSAFDLTSISGGILSSGMILAMDKGMTRSIYSGDIGVGLDAAIQSETSEHNPKIQATLATYALFMDTFICFSTMMIVYLTGTYQLNPLDAFVTSCAMYIPQARLFVTILLLIAGFTTVLAVLNVGVKSSKYLSLNYGKKVYLLIAIVMFIISVDISLDYLVDIMLLTAGITLILNMAAITKLRKEIEFR